MSRQLIYTGKAKDIYTTSEDENLIISVYKDQATMLNGARKETIKGKGVLNNQISSLIFTKLNEAGVATHFVKQLSETEQLNKKVDIVPLEVVTRNIAAGHFSSRYGLGEGEKFDTPVEELFYKSDELDDPIMNESDAIALHIATAEEQKKIWELSRQVNKLLIPLFDKAGMELVLSLIHI